MTMSKKGEIGAAGDFNYSGYFDWPGLYATIMKWAGKEMLKIYEPLYKDKTTKQGFAEREFNWIFERKVDRMHKYTMNVNLRMWDIQNVEVTKDGVTKNLDRGRMRLRISAEMNNDYQGLFSKPPWDKLFGVYGTIMNWDWGFQHWDPWYNKMFELQAEIKNFLGVDSRM